MHPEINLTLMQSHTDNVVLSRVVVCTTALMQRTKLSFQKIVPALDRSKHKCENSFATLFRGTHTRPFTAL